MASEHVLQLKAVLDTSDVKQKLDQLKGQTQAAGANAAGGSATSLAGTLRNLNTTLQNLQRSIEKLVVQSKNMSTSIKSTSRSPLSVAANAGGFLSSGSGIRGTSQYQKFNQKLNEIVLNSGAFSKQEANVLKMRYGLGGKNFGHNMLMSDELASIGFGRKEYINLQKQYVAKNAGSPLAVPTGSSTTSARQRRINRQLITLGAGVVLGGIADYAQASGNKTLAKGASWGSNIAMGAGMGAMMGGPAGAAIGAAAGLLQSAFQELAASAKEAAEALDQQRQNVFKGQAVDNKVSDFLQQREDKAALKKGDIGYFQREADRQKKWADNLQKSFEEGEIGFGGKGKERFKLREYERETQRLMELRGQNDPEVKRRQDYAKLYTANIDVWMKHSNRAEQMQDIADQLKDKKPKVDVKQSILSDRLDELTDRLAGMKAPEMGNVNSLASQGFMISQSDDEARLSQQNEYLRDIANITREIKNLEQQKGEGATYS